MGLGDVIKSALGGSEVPPEIMEMAKSGNINLPLSGDAENMLGDLLSKGVFSSKSDFLTFIVKQYVMNNMGSMMSGDRSPPESAILDIIHKAGLDKGYPEGDIKNMMVPLLVQAFFAVYRLMSRQPAMKPA
jgi:hypothetical protein